MNEKSIRLLDCTLRDGGHLTQGVFGEKMIRSVIKRLVDSRVDIVEVGFLWESVTSDDTARFTSIADVKRFLPDDKKDSVFSLMADFVDLDKLEPCDGTVEIIRLSFKRQRLEWALSTARKLMAKGYKCFINPVNCNVYTDEEYIEVLKKVNELKPYGFSIVDTFGVLRKRDLSRLYEIVESQLDPDITIGLHLHENLGLAYSLAQHFLEIRRPTRQIVVDGSLLGMGREPGNLCMEQIMDHLNAEYGSAYHVEPALDAIDDYIAPLKNEYGWGYAVPYMLSAKYGLHRTYAEHLMGKKRLDTKGIQRILSQIDRSEAELFNEDYVEGLYRAYLDVEVDDGAMRAELRRMLEGVSTLLLIAPGKSIAEHGSEVRRAIAAADVVIGVNFCYDENSTDFIFCTNIKRLSMLDSSLSIKTILTSNLAREKGCGEMVISFNELAYHNGKYCDDSTVMMISLLAQLGYKGKIMLAGFDGFSDGLANFCEGVFDMTHSRIVDNQYIDIIMADNYADLDLELVTPSLHRLP